MDTHNIGVVIGRFQPFHQAHLTEVILPALNESDTLVILLGSSQRPRTPKDPWTDSERAQMIFLGIQDSGAHVVKNTDMFFSLNSKNIFIVPLRDCLYSHTQWQLNVQEKIRTVVDQERLRAKSKDITVSLFGVNRDDTTYYLEMFPQWKSRVMVRNGADDVVNGTMCRKALFTDADVSALHISPSVKDFISSWMKTEKYLAIKAEYDFLENYKKEMAHFKYPIIFQTADNFILWKGHVLLAKRRSFPGDGLWALPGGFVDGAETIADSAIRIAKEKTKIGLRKEWLVASKTFDHPKRSLRGRTITTVHFWKLPDSFDFNVEPGKNTSKVQWFELFEALSMGDSLYEDHLDIMIDMLSKV